MHQDTREEKAIVLDFLPNGYPFDTTPIHKKTSIAQAIGANHFILLELVPKKGVFLQPFEEVYVGEGKRDKIHHVLGKIPAERLTGTAEKELEFVVKDLVIKNEQKFVNFFNKAGPINTRRHQLELLPGVGKKHMWEILEKREEKPFESFEDIKSRVKLLPDPKNAIIKKIVSDTKEDGKHKLIQYI